MTSSVMLPLVVEKKPRAHKCRPQSRLRKSGTSRPKGTPRTGLYQISNGAADEVTYRRNTEAYERCDLVLNVLAGVESI